MYFYFGFSLAGPTRWGTIATDCSGQKQSPINIDPTVAVSLSSLGPFVFRDYDSNDLNMTLKSNGHAGAKTVTRLTPVSRFRQL